MPGIPTMTIQNSTLGDPKRVLSLMTKPLSVDLPERHLVSIRHLCKESAKGCTLQSLPELTQILDIVVRSLNAQPDPQLTDATCDLLRVLSLPFKRAQASDDIHFVRHIGTLLTVVGRCLQAEVPVSIRCRAAVLLEKFADTPTQHNSTASRLDQKVHTRLLAESNTASSLAAAIDIEVQDQLQQADHFSIAALQLTASSLSGSQASYTRTALLTALLQAAIACSANTQLSEQFMAAGLMGTITALLDEGNVHNPQTALAVELLWNLLDSCPVTEPKAVSSSVSANSGPRLQIAKESQLSAEADPESGEADLDASVAEASDAEQATNVNLTAGLEAESSAVLNQQGSSKWDFAQGSQELAAESDTASTPSIVDDLTATGRSRAHSLATTGRSMPRSLVATMATTGRSTMQSRHGASVKFSDIGDDGEATAGDEDVRTASPDAAGVPSDNPPASHDTQALLEEDSTAESAAISPLPEIEIDQQSQQLASSLSRLFENCLERGHSQADKELRNTVLLVAGLLAESCMYRAALCQAGLLQTLLAVSTEPELQELTPTYFQASWMQIDAEDLELRQLAWTTVTQLLQHATLDSSNQALSFIRVLLMYIQQEADVPSALHWSRPQAGMLCQLAFKMLYTVTPAYPEEFQSCDGAAQVLQFLESCGDMKLMEYGLHHMHKACSSNKVLCTTWGSLCAIRLALAIAGEAAWPQRVRRTALLLMSVLCRDSPDAAQHFLQLEGVAVLCKELEKMKLSGSEEPTLYDFAVLDATWSGIAQGSDAVQIFLATDGLGALLDNLNKGALPLQPVLLTIIADVLSAGTEGPLQAADLFHEWRSEGQQSASHIILDIWRHLEAGKGPPNCSPVASPRRSNGNWSATTKTAATLSCDTLYMKIHAVFSQLGFKQVAPQVSLPDQATLCAVEHWIYLQQGLVWKQMAANFAAEGLQPTESDQDRIDNGIAEAAAAKVYVAERSAELLEQHAQALMQAEVDFVRAKKVQDERNADARLYHKDTSMLSVKERLAAKIKREQMLLDSFSKLEEPQEEVELLLEHWPSQKLADGSTRALSRKASQYQGNNNLAADTLSKVTELLETEGLTRRPSQAALLHVAERLAESDSPAVRKAVELVLGQEFPEEEVLEAEPSSPKSSLMQQYESALRDGRPPPQTIDMTDEEVDVQTLENPTPPDDSEDEGYDSD